MTIPSGDQTPRIFLPIPGNDENNLEQGMIGIKTVSGGSELWYRPIADNDWDPIPAPIQVSTSGKLEYQGTWNASTNTPMLTSGIGTSGFYYVVSAAGATNLDGIIDWGVGDWAIFNGSAWQKIDNSQPLHNELGGLNQGNYIHLTSTEYSNFISSPLTREPTGFTDPENVVVTYDSVARTITLSGTVAAYWRGAPITEIVSGWVSSAHAASPTTPMFLYYNGTSIIWSSTPWLFSDLPISLVIFDSSGVFKFATREVHGLMPWQVHEDLHSNIGTYRKSGGDVSGYVLDSSLPANKNPQVSQTEIKDEDLPTTLLAHTSQNNYTLMSLTGATGTPSWTTGNAVFIPLDGTYPEYNFFSGGVWTNGPIGNLSNVAYWLIGIPVSADAESQLYRYFWLTGQHEGSLVDMQALTPYDLDLGELASLLPEFVFLEKLIVSRNGSTWKIVDSQRLSGSRAISSSAGGSFLSSVSTDGITVLGDGTASAPLTSGIAGGIDVEGTINVTDTGTSWTDLVSVPLTADHNFSFEVSILISNRAFPYSISSKFSATGYYDGSSIVFESSEERIIHNETAEVLVQAWSDVSGILTLHIKTNSGSMDVKGYYKMTELEYVEV